MNFHIIRQCLCGLLFCLSFHVVEAHDGELEAVDIVGSQEPLFVSLGSTCQPAHMLRFCNLRKAAFPFDWIVSMDGEKLLEVLEDDFLRFLNDDDLFVFPQDPYPIFNSYYHFEHLHDGNWGAGRYAENMVMMKAKYQRRIERFRQLAHYQGKVFFLRSAFVYSLTDPHRFYKFAENLELTDDFSLRLYAVLKKKFPELDFTLVILNLHDGEGIVEERRLLENLVKVRVNQMQDQAVLIGAYDRFFHQMLDEVVQAN